MGEDGSVTSQPIEPWLREILRCPSCGAPLRDGADASGAPELHCTGCQLAYLSLIHI